MNVFVFSAFLDAKDLAAGLMPIRFHCDTLPVLP